MGTASSKKNDGGLPAEAFNRITAVIFMNGKATEADIQEAIPTRIRTHPKHGPEATKQLEDAAEILISTWLEQNLYPWILGVYKLIMTNDASKDSSFFDALNSGSYKVFRKWWEIRFFNHGPAGRKVMAQLLSIFKTGVPIDFMLETDMRSGMETDDEKVRKKWNDKLEFQGWCSFLLSYTCANIVLSTQKANGLMMDDPEWEVVREKLRNIRLAVPKFKLSWNNLPDPVKERREAQEKLQEAIDAQIKEEIEAEAEAEKEQSPKKKRKKNKKLGSPLKRQAATGEASTSTSTPDPP